MIRKAGLQDLKEISVIYEHIHDLEEAGCVSIGWVRGVYPTEKTAHVAINMGDMYVMEVEGKIVASARMNQEQVPEYSDCKWENDAPDDKVMVLHTLTVDPSCSRKGYATEFVRFYERFALENGCIFLRMDTNEKNTVARKLYKRLGYKEPGIVDCNFNGIPNVKLVCLEKVLTEVASE